MKLYLLTTHGLGCFYVLADNETVARKRLIDIFNADDYGFSHDRIVTEIKLIADTERYISDNKRGLYKLYNFMKEVK